VDVDSGGPKRAFLVEDRTPAAMAREYALATLLPARVPPKVAITLLAAVVVIATLAALTGRYLVALLLAGAFVLLVLVGILVYVTVKRSVTLAYPPGSTTRVTLGDSALVSDSAIGSQTLNYGAIREVSLTPNAVVLKLRGGAGLHLVAPRGLFTPDDLELLTRRVNEAARTHRDESLRDA
jgi:small-conductance mechanosensitive channel